MFLIAYLDHNKHQEIQYCSSVCQESATLQTYLLGTVFIITSVTMFIPYPNLFCSTAAYLVCMLIIAALPVIMIVIGKSVATSRHMYIMLNTI